MNSYELLNRDLKKYIYDSAWPSLTKIQEASVNRVFTTKNNLILAAPTASGKTEAAFLPVISKVSNWNNGLKIIYISPLIALINDQFKRVNKLCNDMNISVTSWHGEASRTKKDKLIENPEGIILITPESIEAMLDLRPGEAMHLFRDVDWIIIDEIHSFIGNNRGIHLQSLIQRISKFIINEPRFIGMSATLNMEDFIYCKSFFGGNRETDILLDNKRNKLTSTISYHDSNIENKAVDAIKEIYDYSKKESMLVFPNSRGEVESIAVGLKKLAKNDLSDVRYFAHHSSISKDMRMIAEDFAKNSMRRLFTIICTSTLELGIDIGSVDSIVQYNAPHSASSLAQRLGRSGRVSKHSILHLIGTDKWSMIQGLSALDLYERGKIDSIGRIIKPYDVLAQQMLSILMEKSSIRYEDLLEINKKFQCWRDIEDSEIKNLVDYMIKNNYIEIVESEAIIGTESEYLLRNREFFSHFETTEDYSVYNGECKIGTLPISPMIKLDQNILLSASIWKIESIDYKGKKIYVKKALDGKAPIFFGEGGYVSNEIRENMKNILKDSKKFVTYGDDVKKLLEKLANGNIGDRFEENGYTWSYEGEDLGLRTFKGTLINQTITLLLNMKIGEINRFNLDDHLTFIKGKGIKTVFSELIKDKFEKSDIKSYLKENIEITEQFLSKNKYSLLLPNQLKIDYVINNHLDLKGTFDYLSI